MKIFLTGGSGFVGKHILKKLSEDGHTILLLSRIPRAQVFGLKTFPKRIQVVKGDLAGITRWKSKLKKFKPDAAIHLAWEGIPRTDIEVSIKNLLFSLELVKMLGEIRCKHIVAVGTQWEYGHKIGKIKETAELEPFNPLAAAKTSLELFGREIAKEKDIKFSWLRFFAVYGPGQRSGALIPTVIRNLKEGAVPQIKSLETRNDFVYVDDVAAAVAMVLKKQREQIGIYNVGSGKLTSIKKIVGLICKAFGMKMDKGLKSQGQSHVVSGIFADISKIKKEIGWKPATNIGKGIKEMVKYYKVHNS